MTRLITEVLVILLLLVVNGLFAMAEMAVVSARKTRLKRLANQGDQRARGALALAESPNRFLSTVQVGITLVGVPALLGAIGPVGVLDHWLEPVVGEAALRTTLGAAPHMTHETELMLVGVAIAIATAGIAFAVWRLKPAALVAKKDAVAPQGIDRILENKYFVDEGYDKGIVQPTLDVSRVVLWKGLDTGIIDGLFVNGSALLARAIGWMGSQLQTGQVGTYAWVLLIGVITLLGAFTFR